MCHWHFQNSSKNKNTFSRQWQTCKFVQVNQSYSLAFFLFEIHYLRKKTKKTGSDQSQLGMLYTPIQLKFKDPNPISSKSQLLDHWSKTKIKIKIHQVPTYLPSLKLLNLSRERSLTEYISSLRNSSNCKLVKSLFSFLLWTLRIENVTMRISFLTVRK